jgi:hypothetical protein
VEAEDLIFDQGGERKEVEKVGEVLPHVRISVLSETLVIEAIDLSDLTRFVVATEDSDALRISDFESYEKSDSLD